MAKKNRDNLSFIGENIRRIRQVKKLSQAEFSKIFSLARASIGAYEEGRSEPKIETLIQIANYFSTPVDALLTRKLSVAELYKFNRLNEKLDRVHQLEQPEHTRDIKVDFLRVSEYPNFIVQGTNRDYLDGMEKISLPDSFSKADKVIEMDGGEMILERKGIFHGDLLIGKSIGADTLVNCIDQVVTIVLDNGILTRRISKTDKQEITLIADDRSYPEQSLNLSSLLQCWKIIGIISKHIPKPTQTEDRLLRIENELKRLNASLITICHI